MKQNSDHKEENTEEEEKKVKKNTQIVIQLKGRTMIPHTRTSLYVSMVCFFFSSNFQSLRVKKEKKISLLCY